MTNTRKVLALVALALTFGGGAEAATMASAPNYGGYAIANSGGTVTCRLFNAGSGTAQISSRQIITNLGGIATLADDSCAAGLGASQSCQFDANITGNFAFSCRVTTSGQGIVVRGVSEVRSIDGVVLNTLPMQ
jgi:hypothetical protein